MKSQYKASKVTKGSKTFVVVVNADGAEVARLGGNRAVRAEAVIVTEYLDDEHDGNGDRLRVAVGCRVSLASADREAKSGNHHFWQREWVGEEYETRYGETSRRHYVTRSPEEIPADANATPRHTCVARSVAIRIEN